MAGDGKGNIALVWQGFRAGRSVILLKLWNGKTWSKEEAVSEGEGNCWMPAVAYGGRQLWIARESDAPGAHQGYALRWEQPVPRLTRGHAGFVTPSAAVT